SQGVRGIARLDAADRRRRQAADLHLARHSRSHDADRSDKPPLRAAAEVARLRRDVPRVRRPSHPSTGNPARRHSVDGGGAEMIMRIAALLLLALTATPWAAPQTPTTTATSPQYPLGTLREQAAMQQEWLKKRLD